MFSRDVKNESPARPQSASSGSRMIRRAKSFREDIKSRIKRTPSLSRGNSGEGDSHGKKGQSPEGTTPSGSGSRHKGHGQFDVSPSKSLGRAHKKKALLRGGSFTEAAKTATIHRLNDVEKLEVESQNVFKALGYIRDVIEKGILQMLPGSVTVLLETVMETHTLLTNYASSHESAVLLGCYNQVYQSLSRLVKWADSVLLHGESSVDKDDAYQVINQVQDGVKDLIQVSKEKLRSRPSVSIPLEESNNHMLSHQTSTETSGHRGSLPDIHLPLSDKEKQLLAETTAFQAAAKPLSRSSDDLLDGPLGRDTADEDPVPPPKPPLPPHYRLSADTSDTECFVHTTSHLPPSEAVPPLPPKRRIPSTGQYDNATLDTSIPHCSNPLPTDMLQNTGQSPALSQTCSQTHTLTNTPGRTPGMSRSFDSSQLHPPPPLSPRSQSPTSSVGSAISASSQELGDESHPTSPQGQPKVTSPTLGVSTPERPKTPDRLSLYDNMTGDASVFRDSSCSTGADVNITSSVQHIESRNCDNEITLFTQKINQLTTVAQQQPSVDMYDNMDHVVTQSTNCTSVNSSSNSDNTVCAKPPPLPEKLHVATRYRHSPNPREGARTRNRIPSQYDNLVLSSSRDGGASTTTSHPAAVMLSANGVPMRHHHRPIRESQSTIGISSATENFRAMTTSTTCSRSFQLTVSREVYSTGQDENGDDAPPLPPKKKFVEAYIQMFGEYSGPTAQDPMAARHSVHSVNFYQDQWYSHQLDLFHPAGFYPRSNTISLISDLSSRSSDILSTVSGSSSEDNQVVPQFPAFQPSVPKLPPKKRQSTGSTSSSSGVSSRRSDPTMSSSDLNSSGKEEPEVKEQKQDIDKRASAPLALPSSTHLMVAANQEPPSSSSDSQSEKDTDSAFIEANTLDDIDVSDQLIRKKEGNEGPKLRGGPPDALLVYATTAGKNEFMYQEAFLTTYRTFMSSRELIEKLLYRYHRFSRMEDVKRKKLSRNAFSLLIRVVDELCTEVDGPILQTLMDLVSSLLCDGELVLARVLRKKVLEKCESFKQHLTGPQSQTAWPKYTLTTKQSNLTDFKSEHIAQQMTLMDAELFQKIELPEVLLWSKEQNEEHSPNLTRFTEHFNKMSYWCRTRVLTHEEPRDRERCVVKFIKVMKHLRKYNNFNSYLAILSALDSAPVRRLEWQKQNMEALKELCQLIDSTSSFRSYRLALAETEPPCIPYIGLVLQDLTFVHIGNQDRFDDTNINFAKRWQQFHILDNMKRFRKCDYDFKRIEKIMAFFNNFEDSLPEETLWQISEDYKPRGGTKKS